MCKLSVSLSLELIERIDKVVELLDFNNREELIRCAILRFVDRYPADIKV